MGKASKWLKNLLGLKKWSFAKSHKDNDVVSRSPNDHDASKHAAAVTTATVAAAQAAAAVVKLTSNGRSNCTTENSGDVNVTACVSQSGAGYGGREVLAAVMIQSHFRAYLSKRALWALKGLVKLQALVRGHIVRKQTVYTLRQLQAIVRAQTRARLVSESPNFSLKSGPATPEKFEHVSRARSMKHECLTTLKRNGSNSIVKTRETTLPRDDESKHKRSLFHSSHFSDQNRQSVLTPYFYEAQSMAQDVDQSPQFYSSSLSKTGDFTPTKSDGSMSCLSLYSDNPNYMAYTESSKAKARSHSAPKQRPIIHYERSSSSSTKKYSVYGYGELKSSTQRVSVLHANFANKAYPGSGCL